MKKIFVILTIVVALAYATHRVDVATRVRAKSPASGAVPVESVEGTPAPDVIFKDLEGKDVPLSSFNVNGQKLPMNYPIVLGNGDAATKFGGLVGYPTSFLISKDGKEIKKIQGL